MNINRNDRLAAESVGRLMTSLSLPAIAGMILYSLFSLVDTFFIARLGTAALAAMTMCVPIEILLISVGSATGIGITSLLSRTLGSQDLHRADNIAWHGLIICLIYGLIFPGLGLANIDFLLLLFGCSQEIFMLSREYLNIILFGCLFTFIPMIAGNIVQGEGNTILPMFTALAGIILNVILDPLLIFGMGPVPAMGLRGAAWATVVSQMFCAIFSVVAMYRSRSVLSWSRLHFRPSLGVIAGIYKVGIPSLLMELLSVVLMVYFNRIMMEYGFLVVAVMGIFVRIRSLFYMPIYGLAQGVIPMVGFAYGAHHYDRVKETIIKAVIASLSFVVIGWYMMQYHGVWLMGFFSHDENLSHLGIDCMRLATLVLPVMGPIIVLSSTLQAVGQGTAAMWLSIIRQIGFFLPALLILPSIWGVNGIWLAFSVSEFLSGILALLFFARLWKRLQTSNRYTVLMAIRKGKIWNRLAAWLKW